MGDVEDPGRGPLPERVDQVQDPGLGRHVEPGGRLVEDEQGGFAGERGGDRDPLLLAAGELVRVAPRNLRGVRELDGGEQLKHAGPRLCGAAPLVLDEDLNELVPDGQHRVERARRVLEDHREPPAPETSQLALGLPNQVLAAEAHLARDLGFRFQGRHHRERDRAFP